MTLAALPAWVFVAACFSGSHPMLTLVSRDLDAEKRSFNA